MYKVKMSQLISSALVRAVVSAASSAASRVLIFIENSVNRDRFKNASKLSRTDAQETRIYKRKAGNVSHQGDHAEVSYAAVFRIIWPYLFGKEMFKITNQFLGSDFSNHSMKSNNHEIHNYDTEAITFLRPLDQPSTQEAALQVLMPTIFDRAARNLSEHFALSGLPVLASKSNNHEIHNYDTEAITFLRPLDQPSTQEAALQVLMPTIFDREARNLSEQFFVSGLPVLASMPARNSPVKQTDIWTPKSGESLEDLDRDGFYDEFYNIDDTENEVEEVLVKNHGIEQKDEDNNSKVPEAHTPENAQSIQPSIKWSDEDIAFSTFVNFAMILDTDYDLNLHLIEQNLDVFKEKVGFDRADFLFYKSHASKSLQCI